MKLFEYVVWYAPVKDDKKAKETRKARILVDVTRVLAESDKEVMIHAAREIPKDYMDKVNEVQIAVRPF